jgi:hypothetical protein
LNPKRLKGISAFATTFGLFSFAESQCVNSIEVVKEGENRGKLQIKIALSPFSSKTIVADVADIHSVVSVGNDDLGKEDQEGNVISIVKHIDLATGQ